MFKISAKKGLCDGILGSEVKPSDLAAHFSRNSGAANTILFTIQMFNEYSRMKKLRPNVFSRPHAMKRHKMMSPTLTSARPGVWAKILTDKVGKRVMWPNFCFTKRTKTNELSHVIWPQEVYLLVSTLWLNSVKLKGVSSCFHNKTYKDKWCIKIIIVYTTQFIFR